jgi:hypothetical protein
MTNPKPIEEAHSAALRGSFAAMKRAAQRARETAARTGTAIVVMRNGVLEHLYPQPSSTPAEVREKKSDYTDQDTNS